MTFSELLNKNIAKYGNKSVLLQLIYSLSKKVKTLDEFAVNSNQKIDFSILRFNLCVRKYFIHQQPLGYITKNVEFLNIKIITKKGVLIPRNETEELTQKVIDLVKKNNVTNVADLCSGTGCIGICVATNTSAHVTCVDVSKKCTSLEKKNAKLNDVKIDVINGDFYKTLVGKGMKFECIVCNPPYVSLEELDKKMLKYEPRMAFNNGNEYSFYKTLINNYKQITTDKFIIAFEIGHNQKEELTKILQSNNLLQYSIFFKDINGKDRMLIIKNY